MRGNTKAPSASVHTPPNHEHDDSISGDVDTFVDNLKFGDGELLKDGTGDHHGGRTLKDRYIVRVGWDDVSGWFSHVRLS